ncbi:hypothetical protein, partial [Candidatus Erwinia dacicola]|uniref:hypothetical protein n=1 Tax=Candidatus Erwinia dacicola TaxID=252393 RepID=UPI001C99C1F9
ILYPSSNNPLGMFGFKPSIAKSRCYFPIFGSFLSSHTEMIFLFMVSIASSGNFILALHIDEAETGLCWGNGIFFHEHTQPLSH